MTKNIDEPLISELGELIQIGEQLCLPDSGSDQRGDKYLSSHAQYFKIFGWVIRSYHAVKNLMGFDDNKFCEQIESQLKNLNNFYNHSYVVAGAVLSVLQAVNDLAQKGLLYDLEGKYTSETFDDFLVHAEEYYKHGKKMESGVISGVVFEDTIRKICTKHGIETEGKQLEHLINALKSEGHIEKTKASRCKVASMVRGTAAHANWDELDIGSVRDTIALTRELLGEFLER